MTQYDFDKLLEKYLAGESSPEEEKLVQKWSETMLEQSQLSFGEAERRATGQRIWKRIYTTIRSQHASIIRPVWMGLSIAASLLLVISAGIFFWQHPEVTNLARRNSASTERGTIDVNNTSDKPQEITLKDGSSVVLKAKSSLSYPERFGDKTRQVYLRGEAFFKVKRDPARPFIVHTGNLVTQVLGTSFTVKSYDDAKAIEVLVATGRVSVYEVSDKSSQGRNGVILVPNQKITFDKVSQKLTLGLIETPRIVQPPESRTSFVFDQAPLDQVFTTLRKAYGIEFIVQNQALSHCIFNGDLNDLPLYVQLDLICKSVDATYERRGTTLFIEGEGCPD